MSTTTKNINRRTQRYTVSRELRVQRDLYLELYFNAPINCANTRDILTALLCQNEVIRLQNNAILSKLSELKLNGGN